MSSLQFRCWEHGHGPTGIMQNGLSPQSKRKWNENYSGRLLKKSRLRMAVVVVDERILNEGRGNGFLGAAVSFQAALCPVT